MQVINKTRYCEQGGKLIKIFNHQTYHPFILKKSFLLIIYLSCLLIPVLQAQSYYFKNYQVTDGLSSNTITSSLQDKKGFMWFGSRNGLNRFDGNFFRIFRNRMNDSSSIGSNSILSLFEDKKEQLWVGTTKGIYIFDPVKEQFRSFTRIPAGEVRYIKEDSSRHIWIISDYSLFKYDIETGNVNAYKFDDDETVCLNIAENGTLWIATSKGLVKKYIREKDVFEDFNLALFSKHKEFSRIQEIYPMNDSLLLVGTLNHAFLFNIQELSVNNVSSKNSSLNNAQIHTIIRQSAQEYWIGTENGLYVYNLSSGETTLVKKNVNDPYSITDNVIFSFCKDKEGNTWIGTFFGGINYYSRQFNKFQKYYSEPGKKSLTGNIVHEITGDDFGNIWIGTEDAGLNKLDSVNGNIQQFKQGTANGSISYDNIHGLLADGNDLWIGTYEHGLDVMNIKTAKVTRHYNAGTDSTSLKSNFIVTIYKTRKHDILIGTWMGMFKYNRVKDNFTQLSFFNTQVQAIHEDSKGTIWASTYGNGVYFYNPQSNEQGILKYDPRKNSLVNNYVNGVFEDHNHNLWFSTEGGLSKYRPGGHFTNYTIESGLPDNQIFRVLEDADLNLWISTSKGMVRFNTRTGKMTNYKTTNGLPTEQFNYNSAYKHTDGTFFFGTVKGLVSFKPWEFKENTFVPPVYITGIQVNNSELAINEGKKSAFNAAPIYADKVVLPYDNSNITFDVAALSYTTPEMNEYQYKMKGFDKDWTKIVSNRKIYYTKLPPGEYLFMVKGSSGGGVWNNKETTLKIVIQPPYWATIWAYILYFFIFAAITFTIVRYYNIALNARNKRKIDLFERDKEREIYNSKIEFFTNVAHEIRTPLTLIKMPLDKLIKDEGQNLIINESLQMIKKNTNRLIDLTNQLLDFRKAETNKFSLTFTKTDINELLEELFATFKSAAEQKDLQFKIDLPRITLTAYVDEEAVKKIIANLINNAIKYSEKEAHIRLLPFSSEDTMFNIEFTNDGYQIPMVLKEKIFEPFYRIKETEKEAGTGIGLPLAKSLAALHKGTLELKNSPGKQNMFLLSLPIHQDMELDLKNYERVESTSQMLPDGMAEPIDSTKPLLLVVEDNKEILGFIQKELSPLYNVLRAYNGQEAIAVLEKETIDLVISDIMMPVMDGIELSKKLKTDIHYSHIPIILLTAKNSLDSKIEGLEVGADAYIEKPFAFEHLLAQIINLLNNRKIIKEYFAGSPLAHIKGIAISNADKNFIESLNNVIHEHITDMELDVDQLSRMMNMSRASLYRKIKALSDLSPNELINVSRLKKAAELLSEGNYKINEVANMVGYTLPTNFARDFNKQFGVTPTSYVNQLKSEKK